MSTHHKDFEFVITDDCTVVHDNIEILSHDEDTNFYTVRLDEGEPFDVLIDFENTEITMTPPGYEPLAFQNTYEIIAAAEVFRDVISHGS